MVDITQVIIALIGLLGTIVTAVAVPLLRSKLTESQQKKLNDWVKIGVSAAEQLYKSGTIKKAERKQYVVDFLNKHGMTADLDLIETMLEAAVYDLPDKLTNTEIKKVAEKKVEAISEDKITKSVEKKVESAVQQVVSGAATEAVHEVVKTAVESKVQEVADAKVEEAVQKVTEAVESKVEEAVQKVSEAVDTATPKLEPDSAPEVPSRTKDRDIPEDPTGSPVEG